MIWTKARNSFLPFPKSMRKIPNGTLIAVLLAATLSACGGQITTSTQGAPSSTQGAPSSGSSGGSSPPPSSSTPTSYTLQVTLAGSGSVSIPLAATRVASLAARTAHKATQVAPP